MQATHLAHPTQGQQEERARVTRTHPRYAFDNTWQHNVSRCENGKSPILGVACRCRGTLFGKKRGDGFAYFAQLPADDPHSFQVPGSRSVTTPNSSNREPLSQGAGRPRRKGR